jgi:hypothetical protein
MDRSSYHLTTRASRFMAMLFFLVLATGCSNIIRSGLMNSNTVFLDPSMNRTAYLQVRNTSENQNVTLSEIQNTLITKGYQLTKDPELANYWIQAKVVYCHKAAEGVTPESVANANFGAGISSGGTTMVSANLNGKRANRERDAAGRDDRHGSDAHAWQDAGHERFDGAGHGHE